MNKTSLMGVKGGLLSFSQKEATHLRQVAKQHPSLLKSLRAFYRERQLVEREERLRGARIRLIEQGILKWNHSSNNTKKKRSRLNAA